MVHFCLSGHTDYFTISPSIYLSNNLPRSLWEGHNIKPFFTPANLGHRQIRKKRTREGWEEEETDYRVMHRDGEDRRRRKEEEGRGWERDGRKEREKEERL